MKRTFITSPAAIAVGLVILLAALAGCGAKSPASSSVPAGGFADAQTAQQLEVAELTNFGVNPPVVQTTAFENSLLQTKPLTFAIYVQAMQAMVKCSAQTLPGLTVKLVPGATLSYVYDLETDYSGPPSDVPALQVVGECAAKYSAAVEAAWQIQNRVSGAALVTQRQQFLQCVIAAGVQIPATATFAQIHSYFTKEGWASSLSAAQQRSAASCVHQFGAFLNSL